MMRADLVLRNGRFYSHGELVDGGIALQGGRIASMGGNAFLPSGAEEIDLGGAAVLPGGVDTHVHVRDPGHRERGDFATETAAAAAGGITTIFEMPISSPPQYCPEILAARIEAASLRSCVDFAFYGAAGKMIENIEPLAKAGIIAFKTFLFRPPAGRPEEFTGACAEDDGNLLQCFGEIARTGKICAVHAENDAIVRRCSGELEAKGRRDFSAHGASRPPLAEISAVDKVIRYARSTGARVSICHVSTPEAMELVRKAKQEGLPVFAETCPQYLFCDEESAAPLGPFAKFNPPIRDRRSVERLWEYVVNGTVDFIGSDHGPFLLSEKSPGIEDIFRAPAGSVGFEECLPLMITAVRDKKLSLGRMVSLLSENAARIFALHPAKGAIAPGADGDLAVVDMDEEFTVCPGEMKTKARSIARLYEGRRLFGRVRMTLVRGRIVYARGQEIHGEGWGRHVLF